ncbi:hypothetical protein CTI12_AA304710 [Artemisia annua]|uniref:Uncharacterized protein n=1 Tax=Artemisia annua TaxID=35608 RepID=A0A2U1N5Q2_ARTAN|nr:hypothetical protein CTI12_AA304710 [Artemisia annua]
MEPKKNRDPRKSGRGSRGGPSRGSIRPRVQSQTGHRPQMYSQSQPGYESSPPQPDYRPQMYPQSPPFFYNQQPLPQLPTNFDAFDTQYTQLPPTQMPTNFDPYEPRYTQKKRRDRVSEPLPIHDDNEDDDFFDNVDVIPETQPIDEDAEQKRLKGSGCDDLQVFETAQYDFEKQFRKAFAHTKAWNILKDQEKWKEQPVVGQASESTGSSKKRKPSESSSAQTPTNETPIHVEDFDLPNLNENPTPSRQSRGKKKVDSGDTSRSSMRDTLAKFRTTNELLLKEQNNLINGLAIEVHQLSKVLNKVLLVWHELKGITTRGGKSTFQIGETPEVNNTSNIPPGTVQSEQEAPKEINHEPEIREEPFIEPTRVQMKHVRVKEWDMMLPIQKKSGANVDEFLKTLRKRYEEGVKFRDGVVIEKPEHGIFFIDAFDEYAFQRVSDLEIVDTQTLFFYKIKAIANSSLEGDMFV